MPNDEQNFIKINGENFKFIKELENVPITDSFVKSNKLKGTTGHGEAKLYVGAQQKNDFEDFFRDFKNKAFFLKRDLEDYLGDAKFEYEQQEQEYRQDISDKWEEYHKRLQNLSDRYGPLKKSVDM